MFSQGHTLLQNVQRVSGHPHFEPANVAPPLSVCSKVHSLQSAAVYISFQIEANCDVVLRPIKRNEGAYCPGGIGALGGLLRHWSPHAHTHTHTDTETHRDTQTHTHTLMQLCYHTHVHCSSTAFIITQKFAGSSVPGIIWPP